VEEGFHQLAPTLALSQLPEVERFFDDYVYTLEQLKQDAIIPDTVFHDNIEEDADIHHAHSFKLAPDETGQLCWKDGDCLQRIKGLIADVHDDWCLGDYFHACRNMGILTHYVVDCRTPPHLHKGQPWNKHHMTYEKHMETFLIAHQQEIGHIDFASYRDVYQDTRKECIALWPKALGWVHLLEEGKPIPDADNLALCRQIVKAIGDTWLTCLNIINRIEMMTSKKPLGY